MAKSTEAEVELRVEVVYRMILDGETRPWILRNCSEQWKVSTRQVSDYITEAKAQILEECKARRETAFEDALAERAKLRRDARRHGDLKLVHDVAKDEAKLLGLYPAEKVEHSGPGGSALTFSVLLTQAKASDGESGTPAAE